MIILTAKLVIPQEITVHLGLPDTKAFNYTLPFGDYIKSVSACLFVPTWPDTALQAHIFTILTFTLSRVYSNYYPAQGYPFDITNTPDADQPFCQQKDIPASIAKLVDALLHSCICCEGKLLPKMSYFSDGHHDLPNKESRSLAEDGYSPSSILSYYFGEGTELNRNISSYALAPGGTLSEEYPGILRRGCTGPSVKNLQIRLNRVGRNFPLIPCIPACDGIFGPYTESAVKGFQEIFLLSGDGIVNPGTWNKLADIYQSVKSFSFISIHEFQRRGHSFQFPGVLAPGAAGEPVKLLQFFLSSISLGDPMVVSTEMTGVFDEKTRLSSESFQLRYDIPATGIVDSLTWEKIYQVYSNQKQCFPSAFLSSSMSSYPGYALLPGMKGAAVRILQNYLSALEEHYPILPSILPSGQYGGKTKAAVTLLQKKFGLAATGTVSAETWELILQLYDDVKSRRCVCRGQFPGRILKEGDSDL